MPKATFYSKLMLLAIALTLLALAAHPLFPKKVLKLNPIDYANANFFLLPANNDLEGKKVFWINRDQFHYGCRFGEADHGSPCNLIFMLTEDNEHGTDLSRYQTLNMKVDYKGPAKPLRIALRHFDPLYSKKQDPNSGKFETVQIKTKDLNEPVSVNLSEFAVADWWVAQYDIPRAQARPDFGNIMLISFDFEGDLVNSEFEVKISDLSFTGEWVTKEQWYLAIQLIWLAGGLIYTLGRLFYLSRREKLQEAKISELMIRNYRLANESDKFRKLSTIDALTNAFNRYGIEQIIESMELKLESTAIIMFDIDHFKRINDRRGHDAGDRVLQQVCEIVLSKTRSTDKLGRWGGEEFILICPNTSVGMATALAEKLRLLIFDRVFEPSNPLTVTASFGVAAIRDGEHFADSLKRADDALYRAKNMGRNCVIVSSDDTPFEQEIHATTSANINTNANANANAGIKNDNEHV